ncbi:hypothetical protein CLOSTHATH_06628 [Hungatella hathewayi DSM 13479]|uniref:Uncharacterized protein n=1 Tax=Hungatella hathewayi DSM 13479 TaxID=566550 RepID=D3ASM0_9FIRM|nr:hypothetical protein CLOSTHATH_06628 [Hungatella hathewayi DSM 13479]
MRAAAQSAAGKKVVPRMIRPLHRYMQRVFLCSTKLLLSDRIEPDREF